MPHQPNSPVDTESNGQRLAYLRMRRRWTQRQLADQSGYSLAAIKAFEQGRRSLDRGSVILTFASALKCHPTEITGQPVVPPMDDQDGQAAAATVAEVHRALLRHGRMSRLSDQEVAEIDLPELRARVVSANRWRQAADLAKSGDILPALLRDLQVASLMMAGDQRREAFDLLAYAYECAMSFLYKLGHVAAATLATERVVWSTQETEDPLRVLAARWYESGEYVAIGEHELASQIIDDALTQLGEVGESGPRVGSLTGAFHLKAALNAARAADAKAAGQHLKHAERAANELGEDRNDYQLQFGPSNVAIWSVSIPVELGRGREAVRQAEKVKPPTTFAPERRSHFFIDVGRGHWYNGQRDLALEAFLQAEQVAPQQTRMHPGVRETIRTMIKTQKRGHLVELGLRMGVV